MQNSDADLHSPEPGLYSPDADAHSTEEGLLLSDTGVQLPYTSLHLTIDALVCL